MSFELGYHELTRLRVQLWVKVFGDSTSKPVAKVMENKGTIDVPDYHL